MDDYLRGFGGAFFKGSIVGSEIISPTLVRYEESHECINERIFSLL